MEYEVETGVMATCASYAQVLDYTTKDLTPEESASITLEQEMNAETGYDYTFFRGDTRERSSIAGVVGTKAGDVIGSARVSSNEVDDSAGYLNETVRTIAETADNVTIAVSQVATGASSQAESLQEAGKGFAVVADEIRQLADQSAAAAQNIQEAMKGLASDSNKTMAEAGSNAISDTITNLSSISQQNAASSEETRASMQDLTDTMEILSNKATGLNDIAKILDKEMAFFQ